MSDHELSSLKLCFLKLIEVIVEQFKIKSQREEFLRRKILLECWEAFVENFKINNNVERIFRESSIVLKDS